ncbi:MAG: decarboxylating NADP(+)-dependent phosphogluconate dehydrogenase [Actinomycetota bacterium]|nr:decarboxylating NADP(+)-dependent phosphogluconate dehydrogenase [Actinomycetota bacterium]
MAPTADIGVIGLAVMGRNLVLRINDHGYVVAVFNRTTSKVDEFLAGDAAGTLVVGTHSLEELVAGLKTPRRILLMVKAGGAIDSLISALLPLLDPGDIIIDGGNSLFTDTTERTRRVEAAGMNFVGAGISGGEEGARTGPSIMPGGSAAAWPHIRDILQSMAASVDGVPCCDWISSDGAGHYVKMVHNGIEYGDMQVLAEAYDIMHRGLNFTHRDMQKVFTTWNQGPLDSYLVEITSDVMSTIDNDGEPLLEKILDTAGQKGTGKWAVVSSMELGQPTTLTAAAVYARVVSSLLEQRTAAAGHLAGPGSTISDDPDDVVADLHDAIYASKIVSYSQGFMLLDAAADEYRWDLDFASIASMWRGGCIIRSRFLGELMDVFSTESNLSNILMSDFFGTAVEHAQAGWRRTVSRAIAAGIPVPAYSAALSFFDGYRSGRVPANLIQALRDYFGAHTYERVDSPRGEFFHTNWTGTGGDVSASTYNI